MSSGKILFVANSDWYLYNFRLALAKFLRSQGFEVVMVAPEGKYAPEIRAEGFRFIHWSLGRRTVSPPVELYAITQIMKIYRSEKPDLVHHFTIKPVLYGSLAAQFMHIPAVVNAVTGLGYVFLNEDWQGKTMRSFILPLYRRALAYPQSAVIFENEHDRAIFIKHGLIKPEECTVIRGVGVNANYFHPAPEPQSDVPLIVFPSRMLYDKGLSNIVEAGRILKNKGIAVRIALVGDTDPGNPSTAHESDLRKWEKEGMVEWWGFQKDMRSIYQNCHIVTLPSFGEGLPTVLIEAAACGRPIVTTDVAGCRDVVTDDVNGLLVPPNRSEALAQALAMLAQDPEKRARMGAAGRQIVLDKFTDRQVILETCAVYARFLKIDGGLIDCPTNA